MSGFPGNFPAPGAQFTGSFMPSGYPQNSMQPPSKYWTEHVAQDGRKYYYNSVTKQTTWDKPAELTNACPWKEYKSPDGKPYYFNSVSQQSVWQKPQELTDFESKNGSGKDTPKTPSESPDHVNNKGESEIELAMKATLASYPHDAQGDLMNSTENIAMPPGPYNNVDHNSKIEVPVYKTRGEMAEGLRRLFKEKNVPGNATWEQALKLIWDDPRYDPLRAFSEKKQIFNVYKTQKQKEEREEQRLKAKRAKEDLEKFLLQHQRVHSNMSYRKVDQLLGEDEEWKAVPDRDRRDIYMDVCQELAKKEKEEAKVLRKRNIKVFREILDSMAKITYKTTWNEAQPMFLDNEQFTDDVELQSLDKEDALITFQEHIRSLEQYHDEEKERERRKQKRTHRKNREAFNVLLEELHDNKMLNSQSLWKQLYYIIKRDDRFHKMLTQRGSTPLDLFKFYVEGLRLRFPTEKKVIKDILKDCDFTVELSTDYDDFSTLIKKDPRGSVLDEGNIKLAYEFFKEKALGREKERIREDNRKLKKLEQAFCDMLKSSKDPKIVAETPWETIQQVFGKNPAFLAIQLESERMRVFKEYILTLEKEIEILEARKREKKREKSYSSEEGAAYSEDEVDNHQKSRKKHSRDRTRSRSFSDRDDSSSKRSSRKSKKSKKSKHKSRDMIEEGEISHNSRHRSRKASKESGEFDSHSDGERDRSHHKSKKSKKRRRS